MYTEFRLKEVIYRQNSAPHVNAHKIHMTHISSRPQGINYLIKYILVANGRPCEPGQLSEALFLAALMTQLIL